MTTTPHKPLRGAFADAVRHPLEPRDPATRAGLLELAAGVIPVALRWGR